MRFHFTDLKSLKSMFTMGGLNVGDRLELYPPLVEKKVCLAVTNKGFEVMPAPSSPPIDRVPTVNATGSHITLYLLKLAFAQFDGEKVAIVRCSPAQWMALQHMAHSVSIGPIFSLSEKELMVYCPKMTIVGRAVKIEMIPPSEIHFMDARGSLLGKITNLALPAGDASGLRHGVRDLPHPWP